MGETSIAAGNKIAQLKNKNQKLRTKLADEKAENKRYGEALERIDTWTKAYPLKVFPEPDFKKVAEVLKAAGLSLDAVSASNMRHVITRLKDITEQALQEQSNEGD